MQNHPLQRLPAKQRYLLRLSLKGMINDAAYRQRHEAYDLNLENAGDVVTQTFRKRINAQIAICKKYKQITKARY